MAASFLGFAGPAVSAEPDALALSPQWDSVLSVQSGGGYKDNVFLSHANPLASPFVSGNAEAMVLRVAPDGPQLTAFANAEVNHYTEAGHAEHTAFAQALLEQDLTERLKASVAVQYFFQNQYLDVSVSETNREAVAVRGHTLTPRPGVRLDLPGRIWLELETPATRQFFEQPLDDYWEAGPKLTFGRSHGQGSQLSASYEPSWRFYDNDFALTADGLPIEGTPRRRYQHEMRLRWKQNWDASKQWRSTLTLGSRLVEENGGGFTDHTRWFAAAQVHYRARPWEVSAESRVGHYDYLTQTVSETDPSKRRRTEWSAALRVERRAGKHLTLAAGFEHEETLSNDVWETYSVNTVTGTLRWEF